MFEDLMNKSKLLMDNSMEALKKDLASISTGRATPSLLDTVRVEAYGSPMPLNQLATVNVSDASTLSIQVWDKEMVKPVEKAILNAALGFTPMVDGQLLRISVPKLSEERRKEMVKLVKKYGEDKKVSIRNARRESIDAARKQEKELDLSQDEVRDFGEEMQKLTDEYVKKIDILASEKEADIMAV